MLDRSNYLIFDVPKGGRYIIFSTGPQGSDGGGSTGQVAIFSKYNIESDEYEEYTRVQQLNNTEDYSKTYFPEGRYKLTASANYVKFDEWVVTIE